MADIVLLRNIAAYVTNRRLTAAGTDSQTAGAATSETGVTLDRFSIGTPDSAEISVLWDATLAATHTLSFDVTVQHAPDGSTWSNYAVSGIVINTNGTNTEASLVLLNYLPTATASAILAATGITGGGDQNGTVNFALDLTGADRYIRVNVLPVFSATSTDTASFLVAGTFSGADRLPAAV